MTNFTLQALDDLYRMEVERELCSETIGSLKAEIRHLKTIRWANQNLREVRAAHRSQE